ncbi:hypothetical protein LTR91_005991 [Friedmanniomyces endolithicus]|uniref:SnoaL-like domain-containing protein n=1 Tax=Friedmanniomyces endolithicus TaxID=329885 RepID=A0AAN6KTF1_9PEZI|nr:hypothetical protein LTR91_005991 [Friedmanniomyces endolithicus]
MTSVRLTASVETNADTVDSCNPGLYKEVSPYSAPSSCPSNPSRTLDLFANHPDTYVQFMNGRFKGRAGVKRLYIDRFSATFVKGRNGPVHGFLLDHLQAQDIVDYVPGTNPPKAKGRFRTLMSAGTHESMEESGLPRGLRQWWEGGLYENEYIKEDGVWKIFRLRYYPFWFVHTGTGCLPHGVYDKGWQHTPPDYVPPFAKLVSDGDPLGPDEFVQNDERLWPDTRVVPFHYTHPVTGEWVDEADLRAPLLGADPLKAKPARVIGDSF